MSRRPLGALEVEELAALWAADEALMPSQVLDELPGPFAYTTMTTI